MAAVNFCFSQLVVGLKNAALFSFGSMLKIPRLLCTATGFRSSSYHLASQIALRKNSVGSLMALDRGWKVGSVSESVNVFMILLKVLWSTMMVCWFWTILAWLMLRRYFLWVIKICEWMTWNISPPGSSWSRESHSSSLERWPTMGLGGAVPKLRGELFTRLRDDDPQAAPWQVS